MVEVAVVLTAVTPYNIPTLELVAGFRLRILLVGILARVSGVVVLTAVAPTACPTLKLGGRLASYSTVDTVDIDPRGCTYSGHPHSIPDAGTCSRLSTSDNVGRHSGPNQ